MFVAAVVMLALAPATVLILELFPATVLMLDIFELTVVTSVAFGTSLPELVVSITAAYNGNAPLVLGNILGSNIANIFLVMGVLSIIKPIIVEEFVIKQTLPLLILLTVVTFGLIRIPMNRLSGTLLFAFFLFFIYQLTLI